MINKIKKWLKLFRFKQDLINNKAYVTKPVDFNNINPNPITLIIPSLTIEEAAYLKEYAEAFIKKVDQAKINKNIVDSKPKLDNNVLNLSDEKTKLEIAKLKDPKKRP